MTDRERRLAALSFAACDRVPLEPGFGRRSTLERWHAEGLPADLVRGDEIAAGAYRAARIADRYAGAGTPHRYAGTPGRTR